MLCSTAGAGWSQPAWAQPSSSPAPAARWYGSQIEDGRDTGKSTWWILKKLTAIQIQDLSLLGVWQLAERSTEKNCHQKSVSFRIYALRLLCSGKLEQTSSRPSMDDQK